MSIYYTPQASRLSPYIRRMTIALVQGYDEMVRALDEMVVQSTEQDGQPKGRTIGDPTFSAVERRQSKSKGVRAIDEALLEIPEEYRKVVMRWTKTGMPLYSIDGSQLASTTTWTKWRERFLEETAKRMEWWEVEE